MNLKHIYFFSSFNINGISSRYRGLYFLKELHKEYNISSTFIYPGYKYQEIYLFLKTYLIVLFSNRKNNIVIFQKIHTKGIYSTLLKLLLFLRPKRTIYDTDDADYLRYYDKNIYYFMKNCQFCTVGSSFLQEYTRQFNEKVVLLTSPVIEHSIVKENKNKILHIGWVGDFGQNHKNSSPFSHKESLNKILFPILKEITFNFKFTLLGIKNPKDIIAIKDFFKNNKNITLDIPKNINWLDENSIYRRIKDFDIGLSPMLKNEFNIAKSAFKAKQYLSCAVPVLASPVGENNTFVIDGVNGFICKNGNDFKEKIIQINKMDLEKYNLLKENTSINKDNFSMKNYCVNFFKELNF